MPNVACFFKKGLLAAACVAWAASVQAQRPRERYLDPALPVSERVDDLVARMTLDEKIAQMQNDAPAIPRLHVQQYNWWNEGLHGVARSGYATVFPQAIGLAATWDTSLIERGGDAISIEARAKYNEAQREGNHAIFYGLTFWSPNVNIDRDPRWGRGQETYGEDPFLTGEIGAAFVRGMQGNDPRYLRVVATAKHFAVHSGPESERHGFDAAISAHDLADTYLPAFRELVTDAHAASVMCAYNAVDGAPACANTMLLAKTLRGAWGFAGPIVSDCGAIADISEGHKFAPDAVRGAADALHAGTDLSCGHEYAALADAVHRGLVRESEIDAAVKRLFTARFGLGMFDPPSMVPFSNIAFAQNDSPAHRALSLEVAKASIVLLKNEHNILPLTHSTKTIAVVGPNAAALASLEGNYNPAASDPVTPLRALQQQLPGHVRFAQGSAFAEGMPLPVPETLLRSGAQTGLRAEYFSSSNFIGTPTVTRIDRNIDFDWNGAAPAPGIAAKHFSVRWTGTIAAPAPGDIPFSFVFAHCSTCDDGETLHVWLDGVQVYDFVHAATRGRHAPTPEFTMRFADMKPHALRIEYTHDAPHFGAGLTFAWRPPAEALRAQAVDAAKHSDVVLVFAGLSPELEGEEMPVHVEGFDGGDRTSIELPRTQCELIDALAATGKPIILVLMNGSAIALGDTEKQAAAIVEAWYPGEAGGTAIAQTLFGANNPSGRLPVTFYAATSQLPPFADYAMQGRTYRYFAEQPEFGFGFGLSYTKFHYTHAELSMQTLRAGDPLSVKVTVANTGPCDGDEVIEAYLIPRNVTAAPLRALVAFRKTALRKGETKTVSLRIDPRQLSLVDASGARHVAAGDYELSIGGSQPDAHTIVLPFRIAGNQTLAP